MRLSEIYRERHPAISIEFFPPKTPQGEANLATRIPIIKSLNPSFCSVTYGAAGSTRDKTLWWTERLKNEFGLEVMCHLTCVGQSKADIEAVFDQLQGTGIENIIALRGDPPVGEATWSPHPDGYRYAIELVRAARQRGFSIAVAGFPEVHPEARDRDQYLDHVKAKVDAGADAVVTQLFLDNADYYRFVDDLHARGVSVPIVPGILPFKSVAQLRKFTTVYARSASGPAKVPASLEKRLAAVENDDEAAFRLGIEYATEQCTDLIRQGAAGIHFYCLNESHAVEAILRHLKLAASSD